MADLHQQESVRCEMGIGFRQDASHARQSVLASRERDPRLVQVFRWK